MRPFEELDYAETPLGPLSLRRRRAPGTELDIYEIKLGEQFLMSSLFTEAEIALSRLALAARDATALDIAIGGLGLGYTAVAALEDPRVADVLVIDRLPEVIRWHEQGLLPLGATLCGDPRCHLVAGDFFSLLASPGGLDQGSPGRRFDAVIVDIDHSPRNLLDAGHASLYGQEGLSSVLRVLKPSGVFALWSDDPPDDAFGADLRGVFATMEAHVIRFHHPVLGHEAANTVYVAVAPG